MIFKLAIHLRRIALVILGSVILGYFVHYSHYLWNRQQERLVEKAEELNAFLFALKNDIQFNNEVGLADFLDTKRKLNVITAYAIVNDNLILKSFPEKDGQRIDAAINHPGFIKQLGSEWVAHLEIIINNSPYQVKVVQARLTGWQFIWANIQYQASNIISLFAVLFVPILIGLLWAAVYFVKLDTNNLIHWLKNSQWLQQSGGLMSEGAERLAGFLLDMNKQKTLTSEQLAQKKNLNFSASLWVKSQLQAGINQGHIVLGSFDLNNSTELHKSLPEEVFTTLKSMLFTRATHLSERMHTLVESNVGDSFVIYHPYNSQDEEEIAKTRVLMVIRGLFELTEELSQQLVVPSIGTRMTGKASMGKGPVQFYLVDQFAYASGEVMEFTNRLHKCINEKSFSNLVIEANLFASPSSLGHSFDSRSEKVQTRKEPVPLLFFDTIFGYKDLARKNTPPSALAFLKTDQDVFFILKQMEHLLNDQNQENFVRLYKHLRETPYLGGNSHKPTAEPGQVYNSLGGSALLLQSFESLLTEAKKLLGKGINNINPERPYELAGEHLILSSLARLCLNFYSPASFTDTACQALLAFTESPHGRVVASSFETLLELKPQILNLDSLIQNPNNRIAADTLLWLTKTQGLTDKNFALLKTWLSKGPFPFTLSGFFVAYECFKYWSEKSPEVFTLNDNYYQLYQLTLKVSGQLSPQKPELARWLGLIHKLSLRFPKHSFSPLKSA